jgi:alginate O-acetyltransferase complex protein AlgJ
MIDGPISSFLDPDSPIVVLGDSFTGVFERTDCGSAGVSAHLARELRYPVDLVMSYGGGPNVRNTLLTWGEATLRRMRLVVWIFAARDLYNYWDDWEPLSAPKP